MIYMHLHTLKWTGVSEVGQRYLTWFGPLSKFKTRQLSVTMMLDNAVSRGELFCVKKLRRRHIWQEATSLQRRRQQQLQHGIVRHS